METRAGTVALIITDLTKTVTFTDPMPSTNYSVLIGLETNVAVVPWVTAKLKTGFTLNLSLGVVATVAWIAVQHRP